MSDLFRLNVTVEAPLAAPAQYRTALNGDAILSLEFAGFIADINYRAEHREAAVLARRLVVGELVRVTAMRVDPPQSFGRGLYPLRGAQLA